MRAQNAFFRWGTPLTSGVNLQFVFKMPSSTNGSLELFTYPPVHKDIPTELYSAGVPLIAERIFSLLNPTDLCSCLQVCTTWNYQVSSVPKFMDKVYAHRRKCKENGVANLTIVLKEHKFAHQRFFRLHKLRMEQDCRCWLLFHGSQCNME